MPYPVYSDREPDAASFVGVRVDTCLVCLRMQRLGLQLRTYSFLRHDYDYFADRTVAMDMTFLVPGAIYTGFHGPASPCSSCGHSGWYAWRSVSRMA
jgi:hypothetical protein